MTKAHMRLVLAVIMGVMLPLQAQAEPFGTTPDQLSFKDWSLYCAPRAGCEASTLTLLGEENHMQTVLTRDWGAEDGVFLRLNVGKQQQALIAALQAGAATLTLQIDEGTSLNYDISALQIYGYGDLSLASPLTQTTLAELAEGEVLRLTASFTDQTLQAYISLSGLTATFRYMDEFQARAGTTSAIIATGDAQMVQLTPPVLFPKTPQDLPVAVRRVWENPAFDCAEFGAPEFGFLAEGHKLEEHVLWLLPCGGSGAYNAIVAVFIERADGTMVTPTPLPLPIPVEGGLIGWDTTLSNPAFNKDTGELSSFYKGRGIGDCGLYMIHQWSSGRLALKQAHAKGECDGENIDIEQWPLLFKAGVN